MKNYEYLTKDIIKNNPDYYVILRNSYFKHKSSFDKSPNINSLDEKVIYFERIYDALEFLERNYRSYFYSYSVVTIKEALEIVENNKNNLLIEKIIK